jgi:hypothetical protein
MIFKKYLPAIAILFTIPAFAQDKIYKTDGDIIEAKVRTVGTTAINYTRFNNQDGPEYTILKRDVSKIIYQNGITDNFEKGGKRPSVHARVTGKHTKKMGDNIVTLMPAIYTAALFDGSVNDPGIGICYERLLDDKGHIGFVLPVVFNFAQNKDFTGNYYYYNYNNIVVDAGNYHSWMFMPGIKFYPAPSTQKFRYGMGLSLFAMFGNEPISVYDRNSVATTGDWRYTLYGLCITNSINISVTRHFYMEFTVNGAIPVSDNRRRDYDAIDNMLLPMIQFALKTGYRF